MRWENGEYVATDDRRLMDDRAIHDYLHGSYWAAGIPLETLTRALDGSLCFGLFRGDVQVGFARAVTDRATFAYLADVYVLEAHRGQGLGKFLMGCIDAHPDLQGLRRWLLATRDAHGLYARYGFVPLKSPPLFMERHDPDVYTR